MCYEAAEKVFTIVKHLMNELETLKKVFAIINGFLNELVFV